MIKKFFCLSSIVVITACLFACGKYDELTLKIKNAKTPLDYNVSDTVSSMETVTFGSYPQTDASGTIKDPIEWLVLDKKSDKALLLSKDILQCKSYNDVAADINWEVSTLRNWLNDYFYNTAFNEEEKERIFTVNNKNVNSEHGAIGGNNTNDNVFCLSLTEVKKYFGKVDDDYMSLNHNWRPMSYSSNYAKAKNNLGQLLFFSTDATAKYYLSSEWWLRDMGFNNRTAAIVYCYGNAEGTIKQHNVEYAIRGVRPAVWVKYKKITNNSKISNDSNNPEIANTGNIGYTGNTAVTNINEEILYADIINNVNKSYVYRKGLDEKDEDKPFAAYAGYQLYDFNKDGIKELFIYYQPLSNIVSYWQTLNEPGISSKPFIYESYTIKDGKIEGMIYNTFLSTMHVDYFWPMVDGRIIFHYIHNSTEETKIYDSNGKDKYISVLDRPSNELTEYFPVSEYQGKIGYFPGEVCW